MKTYIVNYNPEIHKEAYKAFIIKSYGRDDYILLSDKFLKWQFFDNPFNHTKHYTIKLFIKDNLILGQIGYIPVKLHLPNDEYVSACYPVNLIVRPEFRSLGIGYILLKDIISEFNFLINPGASAEGERLCLGFKMKSLGILKRYICVISPEQTKIIYRGNPEDLEKIDKLNIFKIRRTINTDENFWDLPDDDLFKIFDVNCFSFYVVRNKEFLKWRYLSHPFFKYRFLIDKEKKGILIYREEVEPLTNIKVWRIVELIAQPEICRNMLDRLIEEAFYNDIVIIDFLCSSNAYAKAFIDAGFLSNKSDIVQNIAYLFQPLDFRKVGVRLIISPCGKSSVDINKWYVTKGDSDQDRPNIFNYRDQGYE